MSDHKRDGRPGQDGRSQNKEQAPSAYATDGSEIVDPRSCTVLADLGIDLIVEAAQKRARREVTEGDATPEHAADVEAKFLAGVVRRLFERSSLGFGEGDR